MLIVGISKGVENFSVSVPWVFRPLDCVNLFYMLNLTVEKPYCRRNFSVPGGYFLRGLCSSHPGCPIYFWTTQIETLSRLTPTLSLYSLFKFEPSKNTMDGVDAPSGHHAVPTRHWKFFPCRREAQIFGRGSSLESGKLHLHSSSLSVCLWKWNVPSGTFHNSLLILLHFPPL